jgi:LmbE family N-acetylglucosaminyl deacetylase
MLPLALGPAGAALELLCLGAHSDDIEIGCGGAMLQLLADHPGSRVRWVVFAAPGDREREARESAAAFLAGAGTSRVDVEQYRESYFPSVSAQIKDSFERLKAEVKPDLIFTHRLEDRHQDHRVIAELAWNTFRNHLIAQFEIAKYEGDLARPNCFVPLSRAVAERKVELLCTHFASQLSRSWFSPDTFHGLMSLRAVECNAPEGRAEAFHLDKLVLR